MEDKQIRCVDCGNNFTFSARDQDFFRKNNFSDPKRCRDCRVKNKAQRAFK